VTTPARREFGFATFFISGTPGGRALHIFMHFIYKYYITPIYNLQYAIVLF